MKGLSILLAALVLVTGFAFAQESDDDFDEPGSDETNSGEGTTRNIEKFNAEITIGLPVHWTNGIHNEGEDKTVTASTSIGVGIIFIDSEITGFTIDADFSFGVELSGFSIPTSNQISLSGANVFLGPLFYLFNNNIFRVPLAIGIHFYNFTYYLWFPTPDGSSGSWMSKSDTQFGLGLTLGFQLHFNSGVYLFSRASVYFDFIRIHTSDGYDGTTSNPIDPNLCIDIAPISWSVKPAVGIGIRF
jgi:hypothetical protein